MLFSFILTPLFFFPHTLPGQIVDSFALPGYTGLPVGGAGNWFILPFDVDSDKDIDFFLGRSHQFDQIYLNDGSGHFHILPNNAPWQIPGGTHDALLLDLNGDERSDLILARSPASGSSDRLDGHDMILLRNPDGTFREAPGNLPDGPDIPFPLVGKTNPQNYSVGIASGDFNGDNRPDIVIVNGGMNYLIMVAPLKPLDGQWIFFPDLRNALLKNNLFLGSNTDGNNDGVNDFIDASESSGIGTISDLSTDVVVADFNNDSLDDIFITNFVNAGLAITHPGADKYVSKLYLNSKENPGTFTWAQENFPAELRPSTSASAGDIDRDGDIDLFITNESRSVGSLPGERSRLYLNDGSGKFRDATEELLPPLSPEFSSTYKGIMVDVNNDSRLDLFGAGIHNFLLIQRPDGTFADSTSSLPLHAGSRLPYTFHSYGAAFADVDGNGRLDILTADTYEQNRLQLQTESGLFIDSTQVNLPPEGENTTDAAMGDIDGDGDIDVIAANYKEVHGPSLHLNIGTSNLGYPLFVDASDLIPSGPKLARGVAVVDINGDKRLDILFTGYDGGRIYYNAGNGSDKRPRFIDSTDRWFPSLRSMDSTNKALLLDIEEDGDIDLFLPNGQVERGSASNKLYLWEEQSHTFVEASNWLPENRSRTIQADAADINNDGWPDFLAVNDDGPMALYLSDNPIPPSNAPSYRRVIPEGFLSNNSSAAKFGDIDGDQDIDIIEVSGCCLEGPDSAKYFYENLGTTTDGIPDFRAIPYGGRDFQNQDVELLDLNNDGFLEVVTAGRGAAHIYFYAPGSGRLVEAAEEFWPINEIAGASLSIHNLTIGDANGDSLPDIYLARDNQDLLFYGIGSPTTSVEESARNVGEKVVHLWPNPVTEQVQVNYQIEERAFVEITLVDLRGAVRSQLSAEVKEVGRYREVFPIDRIDIPDGFYYLCLKTETYTVALPFVLHRTE